jgi:rhodanese-related sulfurtransferase
MNGLIILKLNQTENKHRILLILITVFATQISCGQEIKTELPKGKQTTLGLYVTSEEAYNMWKADPENLKILDVRSLEEYIFVGHAEMAWNISLAFQTKEWNDSKNYFAMEPNPEFVNLVKEWANPEDTIMVMCRSGGRSAMAVNKLAEAGFKNVYNITDGMEGDMVKDSESKYYKKRMKNGWKNSGIPWTYDINPAHVKLKSKE